MEFRSFDDSFGCLMIRRMKKIGRTQLVKREILLTRLHLVAIDPIDLRGVGQLRICVAEEYYHVNYFLLLWHFLASASLLF
jgi:hypothetical protein